MLLLRAQENLDVIPKDGAIYFTARNLYFTARHINVSKMFKTPPNLNNLIILSWTRFPSMRLEKICEILECRCVKMNLNLRENIFS